MADEVLKTVQELQTCNKFILKRLNRLFSDEGNHCTCSQLQDRNRKEITRLQSKITELERLLEQKDESHREFNRQFESLKDRIDSLETSVMAVQTDDSKLRSASVRKEHKQYSVDLVKHKSALDESDKQVNGRSEERGPNSDEAGQTSQISQVNFVEDARPAALTDGNGTKSTTKISKNMSIADAASDAQEGAVGGMPVERNTSLRVNHSKPTLTEESSEQKTAMQTTNAHIAQNEQNSEQKPVEVINDPARKSYGDEKFWRFLAKQEIENAQRTLKDLEGVHSVICLDISASMAEGNAWTEAKTFLEDYLIGLKNVSTTYGLTDEHVALVTFGHVTAVQKRFTNRYSELRELIGKQKLGGPSPIYGGLAYGLAAAGSSDHDFHLVNGVQVFAKMVIVTDGRPTEVGQYAGPDKPVENLDETKAKILQCMEEYKISQVDVYCVPVGNADKEYLELLVGVGDGRMLSYKSGKQLARRSYLATKVVDVFGIFGDAASLFGGDTSDLSTDDKRIIEEIKSDAKRHMFTRIGRAGQDKYRELPDKSLAPIGSRVRRGPDWKWNTQDSYGPGTVTGHANGDQVWVEWDTDGQHNVYRYGRPGYDILIVEEPRELKPGQKIAVGCFVKLVTKEERKQTGTVIKLDEGNQKATVRWKDGERGDYSYGGAGKSEIEVCSGFQPFLSQGHVLGSDVSTLPTEKKTKNKNKNIH